MLISKSIQNSFTLKSGRKLHLDLPVTLRADAWPDLTEKERKEIMKIVMKFYESFLSEA